MLGKTVSICICAFMRHEHYLAMQSRSLNKRLSVIQDSASANTWEPAANCNVKKYFKSRFIYVNKLRVGVSLHCSTICRTTKRIYRFKHIRNVTTLIEQISLVSSKPVHAGFFKAKLLYERPAFLCIILTLTSSYQCDFISTNDIHVG